MVFPGFQGQRTGLERRILPGEAEAQDPWANHGEGYLPESALFSSL